MAKGYNPSKAFKVQKEQSERIERDFLKNVNAAPTSFDGMVAKNIKISDIYSAPKSFNFYDPLSDDKKMELIESIKENGILSPIVVWKIDYAELENQYGDIEDVYNLSGEQYCLLSGHNRTDAYNKLYETTCDDKYLTIPAFIFEKDQLDLDSAREVIIDSNYVQRVLSTKEKVKSVMYKYAEIEKNKTKKGRTKELVAEELGLSPTMVLNYKKLGEVIEPLQDMVYSDKINLTSILKIADKTSDTQQWIYDTYGDTITSKILNKVKPYMKRGDIEKLFEKELQPKIKTKKITVDVPEEMESEFKEMVYQWIYNKTKRD